MTSHQFKADLILELLCRQVTGQLRSSSTVQNQCTLFANFHENKKSQSKINGRNRAAFYYNATPVVFHVKLSITKKRELFSSSNKQNWVKSEIENLNKIKFFGSH